MAELGLSGNWLLQQRWW